MTWTSFEGTVIAVVFRSHSGTNRPKQVSVTARSAGAPMALALLLT